jgi:hypothetical protein
MRFNVPGRVIDFYTGGGAYQAWTTGNANHHDWPESDELSLFEAVRDGKRIRPRLGGYYVRAELTPEAVEALRYWAETLEAASADDASWEPDARSDLRTAQRVLERLR